MNQMMMVGTIFVILHALRAITHSHVYAHSHRHSYHPGLIGFDSGINGYASMQGFEIQPVNKGLKTQ